MIAYHRGRRRRGEFQFGISRSAVVVRAHRSSIIDACFHHGDVRIPAIWRDTPRRPRAKSPLRRQEGMGAFARGAGRSSSDGLYNPGTPSIPSWRWGISPQLGITFQQEGATPSARRRRRTTKIPPRLRYWARKKNAARSPRKPSAFWGSGYEHIPVRKARSGFGLYGPMESGETAKGRSPTSTRPPFKYAPNLGISQYQASAGGNNANLRTARTTPPLLKAETGTHQGRLQNAAAPGNWITRRM